MKVALCHHYSLTFHGGGERFLIEVAHQLMKKGHRVEICALPFARRSINLDKILQGAEYHEGWIHHIHDVDVAYFIYAPLVNCFFLGSFPRIGALHAFVFLEDLQHDEIKTMSHSKFAKEFGFSRFLSNLYFDIFDKRQLIGFDAVHIINREAKSLVDTKKQVYYVPNWVDTSHFKPVDEKEARFSVLFVGRRTKGFSTFIDIANILSKEEIDFLAVGPDLESTQNVRNLGFITDTEELIELYSKVHALVYTSKTDVFPLTLLEAAACKVPVVALPTRAIRGLDLPLFYATSVTEFAEMILELKTMRQKREENYVQIAENMRMVALQYDVNTIFPRFLDMLKEVATL